jgi:hypothetical protein
MNHGRSVEDYVEYLCLRSFFADFTFRNPEYTIQGTQRKKTADGEIASVVLKRVWAKVEEATSQFRAIAEALNNPRQCAQR